jgi:MYXO-CTERM domain-containing protein
VCKGTTAICDTTTGNCIGCRVNADCPASAPACNPTSHKCGQCTGDGASGGCLDPTRPACVTTGANSGTCQACSATNTAGCKGSSSLCATLNVCGCKKDSDCGSTTSGLVCNAPAGTCVAGCHASGGNGCPTGQTCDLPDGGSLGICSGQICTTSKDCSPPLTVCNTGVTPHRCVQCAADTDCGEGMICDTTTSTCHECSSKNKLACSSTGKGGACLSNGNCGCSSDSDCGASTSGRICDPTTQVCVAGCRGSGGNKCPNFQTCSSTDAKPGECSGSGADAGAPDATIGIDSGIDLGSLAGGGGCGACSVGQRGSGASTEGMLAMLGLAALAAGRRRSRRK